MSEFPDIGVVLEPLTWTSSEALLWGLATEDVQSISLISDNGVQPNKLRVDGVWLWYQPYSEKVKLPVLINAYDEDHNLIYGKE